MKGRQRVARACIRRQQLSSSRVAVAGGGARAQGSHVWTRAKIVTDVYKDRLTRRYPKSFVNAGSWRRLTRPRACRALEVPTRGKTASTQSSRPRHDARDAAMAVCMHLPGCRRDSFMRWQREWLALDSCAGQIISLRNGFCHRPQRRTCIGTRLGSGRRLTCGRCELSSLPASRVV